MTVRLGAAGLPGPLTAPPGRPAWQRAPPAGVVLGTILLGAAAIRVWGITRQGLWYDEAITGWLVRVSPGRLLYAIPRTESTPPLYYLLLWGWVRVLGHGALGLRSFSAVAGVGVVGATFAAGRLLVGRRAALVAAALVAVNPLLVWYSQEARSYSLLLLGSAVSLWLGVRADARPTWGRVLTWAAVAEATLWTHYFAAFLVGAQALALLVRAAGRARRRIAAATALVVVAAAPLVPLAFAQYAHWHLGRRVSVRVRVHQVVEELFGGFSPPAPQAVGLVLGVVAAAAIVAAITQREAAHRTGARWATAIAALAVGVPALLALAGVDFLDTRNVIGAVVPLSIAVAAGLCAVRPRGVGVATVAAVMAISVALVAAVAGDLPAQRPHWQQVAAALRGPGPRVILLERGRSWLVPVGYDLPRTWWLSRRGRRVRVLQVVQLAPTRSCGPGPFWGPVCQLHNDHVPWRIPTGFHRVGRRRVAGFVITTYRARHPVRVRQPRWRRHRLVVTPRPVPQIPWGTSGGAGEMRVG